jgi:hypothetical protein
MVGGVRPDMIKAMGGQRTMCCTLSPGEGCLILQFLRPAYSSATKEGFVQDVDDLCLDALCYQGNLLSRKPQELSGRPF